MPQLAAATTTTAHIVAPPYAQHEQLASPRSPVLQALLRQLGEV